MITTKEQILSRVRLLCIIVLTCVVLLLIRLYVVQVARHAEYLDKASKRYSVTKTIKAKRGEIFDRNGYLLISNKPSVTMVIDPAIIITPEQTDMIVNFCHEKFDISKEEMLRKVNNKTVSVDVANVGVTQIPRRYVVVKRDMDMLVGEAIKAEYNELAKELDTQLKEKRVQAIEQAEANGEKFDEPRLESMKHALYVEDGYIRYNPKGRLLSNILGFTIFNKGSFDGQYGIESYYDSSLASTNGIIHYERSKVGVPLSYGNSIVEDEDINGYDVYLTIDEPLQAIVEEEIQTIWEECDPKGVCILMVEPKTGNILASAQLPNFDPNNRTAKVMNADSYGDGEIAAWKYHPVEKVFEPGSIMKGVSISLAVDKGLVSPDTLFDAENGVWVFKGKTLRDSSRRGIIPLSTGVQKSSNIVTAKVGLMLGRDELYAGIKRFGLRDKSGLPFKYELTGILPKEEKATDLDVTRISIGYTISINPAQIVRAYCALANNGLLPKLRIVDHIRDPKTGNIITYEPEPPVQVFEHPETAKTMANMLKLVTAKGGTAVRAAVPGYEVAGKTGTSRKQAPVRVGPKPNDLEWYYRDGLYYSSFIGFVPADDPAFVMLISVDEPNRAVSPSIYGGVTCAPAFSRIAERALKYLNVKPNPELLK